MESKDLLLAIDNGTQSLKALLFDLKGQLVARRQIIFEPYYSTQPGWAEQDPAVFWDALCRACQGLWDQGDYRERIAGVSITTQRSTFVNVDKDGRPLRPAMIWLDQRKTHGLPPLRGAWGLIFSLARLTDTISYLQSEAEANWIRTYQPEVWRNTHKYLLLSGYNIALTTEMRLSMGISLSMLQYRVDGTQLNPKDVSDPSILNMVSTSYMPDAGLGAYLYAEDFYVGLSLAQLLNNKVKIFDNKDGLNRLKTHFNLTGGYRYEINRDWALEPSVMFKGTAPKEISFDITAKVNWQKMVWGAVSYRYHESVAILIGYSYEDTFIFGYAYDIGINSLRKYNTGTHELMIGYRFNDIK